MAGSLFLFFCFFFYKCAGAVGAACSLSPHGGRVHSLQPPPPLVEGYWIWQAVEEVAWQHMQVGFTDLGGMRSRSSSSGISSKR